MTAAGESADIPLWETSGWKLVDRMKGHGTSVSAVTFSPDGRVIASGDEDGSLRLWDAHQRNELKNVLGHSNPIVALAFSGDGSRLASGDNE